MAVVTRLILRCRNDVAGDLGPLWRHPHEARHGAGRHGVVQRSKNHPQHPVFGLRAVHLPATDRLHARLGGGDQERIFAVMLKAGVRG